MNYIGAITANEAVFQNNGRFELWQTDPNGTVEHNGQKYRFARRAWAGEVTFAQLPE